RIFARSTNGDCERHIGVGYGGGLTLSERLVRAAWRAFLGVFGVATSLPSNPFGFPGRPMTLLISLSVAFPCRLNDENTSHRSMAPRCTDGSPGADTPWTIAR